MISKERLEEIIKNKGVVWVYSTYSKPYRILPITFNGEREINPHTFCLNWNVKNIFETKEDAEWYKEFSCIERTERLELPTWEEFDQSEKLIRFIGKFGQKCKIDGYFNLDLQSGFIDVTENGSSQINLPEYNKENYILACRKAKELFLGE